MRRPSRIEIRRVPNHIKNAAVKNRARFRLINLAISCGILVGAHSLLFHFITKHLAS